MIRFLTKFSWNDCCGHILLHAVHIGCLFFTDVDVFFLELKGYEILLIPAFFHLYLRCNDLMLAVPTHVLIEVPRCVLTVLSPSKLLLTLGYDYDLSK